MKVVMISDTHGQHGQLSGLEGDVLIHCGDFFFGPDRDPQQIVALDEWFSRQRFDQVLCTGGNHDFLVEDLQARGKQVFCHATCLADQTVEIGGYVFHGAPWVPELTGWAHYRAPGELQKAWARIPLQTDVLITHTPPSGHLDRNSRGKHCGCPLLRDAVTRIRPQLHCFGHVHASGGTLVEGGTTFVNASMVNSRYELARQPVVFTLEQPRAKSYGTTSKY
jgi:Icc-related predicted phosphoesterase